MAPDAPIQGILFTVFQSIFQVFLLSLAGFTLSFKGVVDKPTSKVLNHINITLFTPALLFSKVAYFLTPAKLRQLWIIPIFFTVLTGLSALVAHYLARAFRLKRSQVNFATAASMFMNSNSLPVALMQSLATTVPLLKWGPDDTVDAMFGRSLTYLVVFSTLGMIVRWSYGIRLISQADEPEPSVPVPTTYRDADESDGHPPLIRLTVDPSTTAQIIDYEAETDIAPSCRKPWHTRPLRSRLPHPRVSLAQQHGSWHIYRHSHLPAVPASLGDQSESEDSDEVETTGGDSEETIALRSEQIEADFSTEAEEAVPASASTTLPSTSPSPPNAQPTPRWGQPPSPSLLSRFFGMLTSLSPPLVGSLLALFCVLVPPLQRALLSDAMIPLKGALDNAGACSIPLTLLVLGGWFWDGDTKPTGKAKPTADEGKGSDGRNSRSKGKDRSHTNGSGAVPTHPEEDHTPEHASHTKDTLTSSRSHHVTHQSRDSSTTSLSSMIGAFGDVLMGRIHARGSVRAKRHVWGDADADGSTSGNASDVESGLATRVHVGAEHPRSRSQPDLVNGRALLSPISSAPSTPQSPVPKFPASKSVSSPTSKEPHARERGELQARSTNPPGENLTIFVTLLARMVIVPLIVTPLIVLVNRLGWGGQVFEDPVFVVSCMLLVASPPALTLAQISQRAKATATAAAGPGEDAFSPFERLLSRTVFWAYCILTPPVTIVSVMVGLLLVGA